MKGRVYKRGDRNYAVIVEFGFQPAQKCGTCGRQGVFWVAGQRLEACPRCGGPVADIRARRREWYGSYEHKREAEGKLKDLLGDDGASYSPRTQQTVGEYLLEWSDAIKVRVRPTTAATYGTLVRKYVMPHIGRTRLQDLTTGQIDAMYAELLGKGGRSGRGLSPHSVRLVHGMLHRAFEDAIRWRRLSRNPTHDATRPTPGAGEMRTWTAAQLRTFLDHMSSDRLFAAYMVLGTTGARRGEVLGLRWADVDLEWARVSIRRSLVRLGSGVAFSEPKTRKSRRLIALDPTTVATLKDHRKRQLEERLLIGPGFTDQDLVFAELDGSPLSPGNFGKAFRRHVKAAGLPMIRVHDLRHTHATLALSAGIHPKVVSERLGHSTVGITLDVYSHVIPAMQEEAAGLVASIVFGSSGSQKVAN